MIPAHVEGPAPGPPCLSSEDTGGWQSLEHCRPLVAWPPHAFPAPGHLCEPPSTNVLRGRALLPSAMPTGEKSPRSHTRTLLGSLRAVSRVTLTAISDPVAGECQGEDLDPDLSGSKTVLSAIFLPASEQFLLQKHETKQNKKHRAGEKMKTCPLGWLLSNKQKTARPVKMWRSWQPRALLLGMESGAAAVANSVEGPQKVAQRVTIRPSNPTSG